VVGASVGLWCGPVPASAVLCDQLSLASCSKPAVCTSLATLPLIFLGRTLGVFLGRTLGVCGCAACWCAPGCRQYQYMQLLLTGKFSSCAALCTAPSP